MPTGTGRPLPTPLAILLERWLAQGREHVPSEAMTRLGGKTLVVELDPPGLRLTLLGASDRLQVLGDSDEPADVTVRGSPLAFAAAMTRGDRSGLAISGDAVLLKDLQVVLGSPGPRPMDWLEALSGAGTAGPLMDLGEQLRARWTHLGRRGGEDVLYFLQEELRWLVPGGEFEALGEDLADLRDDLARLEQRVQRIEAAGRPPVVVTSRSAPPDAPE